MLRPIDSCQKGYCWPVSADCNAGSSRQLIEMTYFFKYNGGGAPMDPPMHFTLIRQNSDHKWATKCEKYVKEYFK